MFKRQNVTLNVVQKMAARYQSEDGQFKLYIYRPQGKVMFSEASVGHSLSGGGLPLGGGVGLTSGGIFLQRSGVCIKEGGQSSQPGSDT